MRAVLARVRTEFRTTWRSWIVLALIIGAGAGVSMTLIGAARRTSGLYGEFSRRQLASDVVVAGASQFGPNLQFVGGVNLGVVEQLPAIDRSARAFATLLFTGKTNDGRAFGPSDIFPVASQDDRLGRTTDAWKMLDGRRANANKATESVASFELARRLHLHVGSTLDIHFYQRKTFPAVAAQLITDFPARLAGRKGRISFEQLADGPRLKIKVVGIEASPAEFPPLLLDIAPVLHLTPAFFNQYSDNLVGNPVSFIRLKDPGGIESFKLQIERLAHGEPVSFISTRTLQFSKVQRAITVETIALSIIGALVGLTFVVVIGQALSRLTFVEAPEYDTLSALGMSPRQLLAVTLLRCLSIGVVGAAIGCVAAVSLSQTALLALAKKAQLHGAAYADGVVLALGVLVIVLVAIAAALVSSAMVLHGAVRRWVERRARTSGTGLAHTTGRVALPPATAVGLRFALRREPGAAGVPIWTTVVGATVTAALLVGTWVFTASLTRVTDTPHLYGWNWDLRIGAPALPDVGGVVVPALRDDRAVAGLAAGTVTQVRLNGHSVDLLGMQKIEGTVTPTMVAGRAPQGRSEIVLGARTMRLLGVGVGDRVQVSLGDVTSTLTVVGRAVFPEFGDAGQLGTGGFVTLGALDRLIPGVPRNIFFIKFRAGTDLAAERARLSAALEPLPHRVEGWPTDLESIERVSALPKLFSGVLASLAIVLLLHTLLTSVRRRRRELAVLEAIGFVRRQVRTSILMHAVALVVVALLIGIPAGVIAGRLMWKLFETELGLVSSAVIPLGLVSVAIVVAIGLAATVAVAPAFWATRRRPAAPLRAAE
ncbi:MAG: putative transport system permease protein [Actinomycetota bacterium]|nr:putative transport system permease protein [Actinomycetota bacterium]